MKKFILIGGNLKNSLSQKMHSWIFRDLDIHATYQNHEIHQDDISDLIKKLKTKEIDGINITNPYKYNVLQYVDEKNIRTSIIEASNCLACHDDKIIAYNTDWYGFTMLLKHNNIKPNSTNFYIYGAGGAAKAVTYSLIQSNALNIYFNNRTTRTVYELKKIFRNKLSYKIRIFDNKCQDIPNNACIINCTSVGTGELIHASPISTNQINQSHIVIDVIYNPYKTVLLKDSDKIGARAINGLDMFIYQGLTSLDIWMGNNISDKVDIVKLKKYLRSNFLC